MGLFLLKSLTCNLLWLRGGVQNYPKCHQRTEI